jgi:integrase
MRRFYKHTLCILEQLSTHKSALAPRAVNDTPEIQSVRTLDDLLRAWMANPPRQLRMLRSTCSLLSIYQDAPPDQILIDSVKASKDGFRKFLVGRTYKENSIRTYVNHVRILLQSASKLGWDPAEEVPEAWRGVLAIASEKKCVRLVKFLARVRATPNEVQGNDVDQWVLQTAQESDFNRTRATAFRLWGILRDCGYPGQLPTSLLRQKSYGVPLSQFPLSLKKEVDKLLSWKQAVYATDRPKGAKHRPVTSKRLVHVFCALLGYLTNVLGEAEVTSLSQLVQKQIVAGYVEWCINERHVKGETLQRNLRLLLAAMSQHPSYKALDTSWFKPLLDGLPVEPMSEARKRKAEKFLEYKVLESIPANIHAGRAAAEKRGPEYIARVVHDEFLFRWLITLPWRQLNIREMRIGGPAPNLFKRRISSFSEIDKPQWVQEEEQRNPDAEFWQFHFSCDETKMKHEVDAVLPRRLIGPLEEYLKEFRGRMVRGIDPCTLFLNRVGKPITRNQMTALVSRLTLRHGGRRVTPHLFRDIVAYTRLKENSRDTLALSKLFWHANDHEVVRTYGCRFNESSGVCAMESWLDDRDANSK